MGFSCRLLCSTLIAAVSVLVSVSGHEFIVGGEKRGWSQPTGNESETYNEWAEQNRFLIGDTVHFYYQNDSVLQVTQPAYETCNMSDPIETFGEGGATFQFNQSGLHYFISGYPGHCDSGQKIIIWVMAHSEYHHYPPPWRSMAPSPAPSVPDEAGGPSGGSRQGGGDDGWDGGIGKVPVNSTIMLSVTSYFMTTLTAVLLILYLFM